VKYLGIDPGFDRCGWGIVDELPALVASGVIQTSSDWTYSERIDAVFNALIHEIRYHNVAVVGVEKPYAGEKVGKRIIEVGGAWGVVLLAIHRSGCTYMELSNSQVKAAVSGGRADKEAVRKGVETILEISLDGKLDDESDAIAAAICARDKWHLAEMVREAG
jgi:crossover junction endodeoxyribonuclease RuvC